MIKSLVKTQLSQFATWSEPIDCTTYFTHYHSHLRTQNTPQHTYISSNISYKRPSYKLLKSFFVPFARSFEDGRNFITEKESPYIGRHSSVTCTTHDTSLMTREWSKKSKRPLFDHPTIQTLFLVPHTDSSHKYDLLYIFSTHLTSRMDAWTDHAYISDNSLYIIYVLVTMNPEANSQQSYHKIPTCHFHR